jgi:DNA-binding Lrp family transcriptional regulator
MKLDKADISILKAVQKDGRLSNRDLAKEVSLSPSPSWRRLRALEEAGVISHCLTAPLCEHRRCWNAMPPAGGTITC